MKRMVASVLLIVLPPLSADQKPETIPEPVPETIVGSWELDIERTLHGFVDQMAAQRPDLMPADRVAEQKAMMSGATPQGNTTIIITDTTISSSGVNGQREVTTYNLIGGNARLLILECIDTHGFKSITNVRLVEGGIAIETTNCAEQPEVCVHERKRAQKQLTEQFKKQPGETQIVTRDAGDPVEVYVDGQDPMTRTRDWLQPRLAYFKPVE